MTIDLAAIRARHDMDCPLCDGQGSYSVLTAPEEENDRRECWHCHGTGDNPDIDALLAEVERLTACLRGLVEGLECGDVDSLMTEPLGTFRWVGEVIAASSKLVRAERDAAIARAEKAEKEAEGLHDSYRQATVEGFAAIRRILNLDDKENLQGACQRIMQELTEARAAADWAMRFILEKCSAENFGEYHPTATAWLERREVPGGE